MCEGHCWALLMRGVLFQVHTSCKDSLLTKCPLGLCKVSVIPPTALNSIDSDGGCRLLIVTAPHASSALQLWSALVSRRPAQPCGIRQWCCM